MDSQQAVREQAAPTQRPGFSQSVWQLVMADMAAREQLGIAKYGQPVLAFNGRNSLLDAYQEQLDQLVYLRQALIEFDEMRRIHQGVIDLVAQARSTGMAYISVAQLEALLSAPAPVSASAKE